MPSVSDIDPDIDDIISSDESNNNSFSSDTDTGGIAGFSDGVVEACVNSGTVGYPHIGYNTGGIAGRQNGYIAGCTNNAKIYGRKEVGGIAGQSEPYLALLPTNDMLAELQIELDTLNQLIDKALDDSRDIGDTATDHLNSIQSYVNSAKNSTQSISEGINNFANDNINSVNNSINLMTADLSNSMEKAKLAADGFGEIGETVSDIADGVKKTVDTLKELNEIGDIAMDDVDNALSELQSCADEISYAAEDMKKAIEALQTDSAENAAVDLNAGIREIGIAIDELSLAFMHLSNLTNTLQKSFENIIDIIFKDAPSSESGSGKISITVPDSGNVSNIIDDITSNLNPDNISSAIDNITSDLNPGNISSAIDSITSDLNPDNISSAIDSITSDLNPDNISSAIDSITSDLNSNNVLSVIDSINSDFDSVSEIIENTTDSVKTQRQQIHNDLDRMTEALKNSTNAFSNFAIEMEILARDVQSSLDNIENVSSDLKSASEDLSGAAGALRKVIRDLDPTSDIMYTAAGYMDNVMDNLSKTGNIFEEACGNIGDAINIISNRNPSPFIPLSSDIHKQSDDLFDSIELISSESQNLTNDLNSDYNDAVNNLQLINAQIKRIYDIAVRDADELLNGKGYDIDEIIQDTSEYDITNTREGKITNCINTGSVDGDRNVGGVIGAMAIERDLDPEDDIQDNISVRSKFETKAILEDCTNYGLVNAKTDSSGGLVGRMELGTVIDCRNYGDISGADYVGGITGRTRASVRRCFEKSKLSGQKYIGGIAGYAGTVRDCYSITNITESHEFIGAIAGSADNGSDISNNRFIKTGVNGIDNISYESAAAPIPFEELETLNGIPAKFTEFEMLFKAEGRQCGTVKFRYGDDLSRVELPEVPEKEGYYGEWEKFDTSGKMSDVTINALYTPVITITASAETNGKIACALVSGAFTKSVVLHAETVDEAPPSEAGDLVNIYHITLEGSDYKSSDTVPLRLLIPGKENASVWQYVNGGWQTVKAQRNGQYMMLDMTGTEGTFCISTISRNEIPIIAAAVGIIVLLAIITTCIKIRKKRKAKKTVSNNSQ